MRSWKILFVACFVAVSLPLAYIALGLLTPPSEAWLHLKEHLLPSYLSNTFRLLLFTCTIALAYALPSAWLLSAYRFPLSRAIAWIMPLPMAIPPYIAAFTYADMFNFGGTFYQAIAFFSEGSSFDIMNIYGASWIMGGALYAYVYLGAKASFERFSGSTIEAARLLGRSGGRVFWEIALRMARPAIAGSLFLVMMECLNEYGTFKYYGVSTLTAGIFSAWFSMGDLSAAVRLSALMLLGVFALMALERWQRRNIRYDSPSKGSYQLSKRPLSGWKGWLAALVCLIPPVFAFFLPVAQLSFWAFRNPSFHPQTWEWLGNSVMVALLAALLAFAVGTLMVYALRLQSPLWMKYLGKFSTLGYAVPGAVVAVGVLSTFIQLDKGINFLLESAGQGRVGLLFSGGLAALVLAYLIRFLALAYQPMEAGLEQSARRLDEASRTLGATPLRTLLRVNLPVLKATAIGAMLMIWVEVMKELPLTLMLRPFNFETLATKTFDFAGDEQLHQAAPLALMLIAVGLLPMIWIGRKS